jgi:hypothetical protein
MEYMNRHFDAQGHYIRRKDEQQVHDRWLQGLTKNDIEKVFKNNTSIRSIRSILS